MASAVDICNLALSHFGQDASIDAISPPDGSAEAEHAARFYPIALNELLQEFDWTFARKRTTLAELENDRTDFAYRFARPADCLIERRLLPDGYADDQNDGVVYQREGDSIYSDEPIVTLVYTRTLTDTTKFSPLFVIALSWRLGSYIVGPVLKDPSGATQMRMRKVGDNVAGQAKASDANADKKRATHTSTAAGAR
jgi:hypothetical protein